MPTTTLRLCLVINDMESLITRQNIGISKYNIVFLFNYMLLNGYIFESYIYLYKYYIIVCI